MADLQVLPKKLFRLVLVKPSHYDDDGYVIQWFRSAIPSNSLAALYGLARDCAERRILGPDVTIDIHAFDETNTRIRPDRITRLVEEADDGMVMLVGVQSNQFPRALDIARPLVARGIQVGVGGFHVSGTISMLAGDDDHMRLARDMGLSLFAGEAEGRLDEVLHDAAARVRRTAGSVTSFDAGRGCPYQCSFCTIINVQGRKSRRRSADDVEAIVRANAAQGLDRFFITDDNFARNKDWEEILDRLIHLREVEKIKIGLIIQVDTLCYKLPNFVEKCARAGVKRVFIGLENVNPANLMSAKKRQNKITEYRDMLLAWKRAGVLTYAGYILGFPNDTVESILHDIEVIKKELPVDLLEFFYLTPLPGSEDHQKLHRGGIAMDADLNRYDLNHANTAHPKMSRAEWERAYKLAWQSYYSDAHIETILRRAFASRISAGNALFLITWFKGCIDLEGIHPLEGGYFRMKARRDRRPGLPIEPAWKFYPKFLVESVMKQVRLVSLYVRLRKIYLSIKRDPKRFEYTDLALSPVGADEIATHELYQSDAAKAFVDQEQRLDKLRHGEAA